MSPPQARPDPALDLPAVISNLNKVSYTKGHTALFYCVLPISGYNNVPKVVMERTLMGFTKQTLPGIVGGIGGRVVGYFSVIIRLLMP